MLEALFGGSHLSACTWPESTTSLEFIARGVRPTQLWRQFWFYANGQGPIHYPLPPRGSKSQQRLEPFWFKRTELLWLEECDFFWRNHMTLWTFGNVASTPCFVGVCQLLPSTVFKALCRVWKYRHSGSNSRPSRDLWNLATILWLVGYFKSPHVMPCQQLAFYLMVIGQVVAIWTPGLCFPWTLGC